MHMAAAVSNVSRCGLTIKVCCKSQLNTKLMLYTLSLQQSFKTLVNT